VPLTVTHAPATRLESGEILSTAEDHERYAAECSRSARAGRYDGGIERWLNEFAFTAPRPRSRPRKESTAVPTLAANAIRLLNVPVLQINHLEEGDRSDEQHAGHGDDRVYGGRWRVGTGRYHRWPSKAAARDYAIGANKPEWDAFMRAAGFSATVSGAAGSGKILYADLDTGVFERLSLYLWSAKKAFQMIDCIVLPKWSLEAAKKGVFTFTVIGTLQSGRK
jgi:hypothetical protein